MTEDSDQRYEPFVLSKGPCDRVRNGVRCSRGTFNLKVLLGGWKSDKLAITMLKDSNTTATVAGIFDKSAGPHSSVLGYPVSNSSSGLTELLSRATHYFVGIIGHHNFARVQTAKYLERHLLPLSLTHPSAIIDTPESLGAGLLAMPGSLSINSAH